LSNYETSTGISQVVITLMKGVIYRDENLRVWQSLLDSHPQIRDYIAVLGLELALDEIEGYAFLRQRVATEESEELFRLVPRRQLGFSVSLLLALLRKKLAEFDASSGEARLIMREEEIVNLLSVFLPDTKNEVRLMDRVESDIRRIVELGFLRRLKDQEKEFEVRRILRAFVDAQWLGDFEARLAEYRNLADGMQPPSERRNA
jgi:Domain of unknown function (DUF4194)